MLEQTLVLREGFRLTLLALPERDVDEDEECEQNAAAIWDTLRFQR
ncbi:hypothetical protein DF3PA_260017 [Candidatus Defluviicoccus seviourii]|uniref:Uncharacterized protein n=1 Tax=Candidatus Defluviicoccus seviourii TaxID=2565273 RepID=A0A564WEC9_9PROT|nr:hypothetical protein DF3PA_260017 [Candidatus Defluviicoccus seviourii]